MHSKQPLTYAAFPDPTQAMQCNKHRSVVCLTMQALTQALGKLRAKMTHQEKENGGKGEDILVTLQSLSANCSTWTSLAMYILAMQTDSCDRGSTCCISMCCMACAISAFSAGASAAKSYCLLAAPDGHDTCSCAPALTAFITVLCPFFQDSF